MNLLRSLKTVQQMFLGYHDEVVVDCLLHFLKVEINTCCLWVTVDKGDDVVSKRVAIDPDLSHVFRLDKNVFDLFRCNVFALTQFENVFGSVNDP